MPSNLARTCWWAALETAKCRFTGPALGTGRLGLADRPVIFYDQLGAGRSDHPTDASLWKVDRFVRELADVRQALGLDKVHILGHSWGSMLAVDYMLTTQYGNIWPYVGPERIRSYRNAERL